jgi:hypothetical protein
LSPALSPVDPGGRTDADEGEGKPEGIRLSRRFLSLISIRSASAGRALTSSRSTRGQAGTSAGPGILARSACGPGAPPPHRAGQERKGHTMDQVATMTMETSKIHEQEGFNARTHKRSRLARAPRRKHRPRRHRRAASRPGGQVREYCRDQLVHRKVPRYVLEVEEFPMIVTGKVKKFEIRELPIERLGLKDG